MPDFHALLRQHLSSAKLPRDVEEELVSHLTELYESKLSTGMSADQALKAVRNQLGDPKLLLRAVRRYKEGIMRSFLRHVLVPGLFATALITFAGNLLSAFRTNHNFDPESFLTRTRVFFIGPTTLWTHPFVYVDMPLLLSCIVAGAFAAYISLRLGGTRRHRLWAALVPSIAPLLTLGPTSIFALMLILPWHNPSVPLSNLFWMFVGYLIGFTILPAGALILGAAPLLARTETPRATRA